jgi:hypothetical protein
MVPQMCLDGQYSYEARVPEGQQWNAKHTARERISRDASVFLSPELSDAEFGNNA